MDDLIALIVKSYGLVGLFMLSPIVASIYLWKDNVRLNNDMRAIAAANAKLVDEIGQRVVAAQEKRVADSQNLTDKLVELISDHTGAQQETNAALDRIGDMVSGLSMQMTTVAQVRAIAPPRLPPGE